MTTETKTTGGRAKKAGARKAAAEATPAPVETPEPSTNGEHPEMSPRQQAITDTKTVRRYLEMLRTPSGSRGRRTPEYLRRRLPEVEAALAGPLDPIKRLQLAQERIDLRDDLLALEAGNPEAVIAAFVECAARYAKREGITWNAWKSLKVPSNVLRDAGITTS